jgi:DNA-directed RNA polymerase specialized sigma24 family protein
MSALAAERVLDPEAAADHLSSLYRLAWSLCGSRHLAEELTQETYARVLARPRRLKGNDFHYLARTLRNVLSDHWRAERRRPVPVSDDVIVDELLAGAADDRTAVMCAEAVWWRCHRKLIADFVALAREGDVRHLMHDGRLQDHRPSAEARRTADGLLVYDAGQESLDV